MYDDAKVFRKAEVKGGGRVYGDTRIFENAQVLADSQEKVQEKNYDTMQELSTVETQLQIPREERLTAQNQIENRLQEYVQGRARSMDTLCQENHLQNPNGGQMQGKAPVRKPHLDMGR